MNELIGIALVAVGSESVPTVNARELHAFLESGQEFRHWIKARIEQYGFTEHQDFVTSDNFIRGGKATDYHVSLDMAKELCMVERNEKGKQARQYFIECERQARAAPRRDPIEVLNDPAAMRGLLLTYSEKVISLEAAVSEAKPKAAFYDAFLNAEGLYGLQNAARALGLKPNMFIQWLKTKYLFYQGSALVPYVQFRHLDIFDVKTTVVDEKKREQTYITPKGLAYLNARVPANVRLNSTAGDNQHDLAV